MAVPQESIDLPQLRQLLVQYLNDSELRDICFDLGIDYDNLPGLAKGDKARELVAYMQRLNTLGELIAVCRRLRPHVHWPNAPTAARDVTYIAKATRETTEQRNRRRMLQKVRDFWIKGVLEKSLYNEVLIELGLEYKPEAVQYPWDIIIERPDKNPRPLPFGMRIVDVFDEQGGELVILGAPGAGKTTMLLTLARTLIERAEQDEAHPIPLVFNLSSWTVNRPPLAVWLADELNARYQVPKEMGKSWVETDQILPLLDGLDEVRQEQRTACVEAINQFRRDHGLEGIVVCSREKDYINLQEKLTLQGAVVLQPLNTEQIDTYLVKAGEQLSGLRTVLQEDIVLQDLAETPLLLSIMSLAYRGISVEVLRTESLLEQRRKHLFDTYIRRMFERRGIDRRYPEAKVVYWLSWLAYIMLQQRQTVFYLEELQPATLPTRPQKLLFSTILGGAISFIWGLLIILVILPLMNNNGIDFRASLRVLLNFSLSICLGTFIGFISGFIRIFSKLCNDTAKISTVDSFKLSWKKSGPWITLGFILGQIITWLAFNTFGIWYLGLLTSMLVFGLIIGLIIGVIFGTVSGIYSNEPETRTRANQGIWQTGKNAVIVWLVGGLISGVVILSLYIGFYLVILDWKEIPHLFDLSIIWVCVFAGLLLIGPVLGFVTGGIAWFMHFILRYILYYSGHTPWNYIAFLDYATERVFLRRVGGGYIFAHRLLLEHFAEINNNIPLKDSITKTSLEEDIISFSQNTKQNTLKSTSLSAKGVIKSEILPNNIKSPLNTSRLMIDNDGYSSALKNKKKFALINIYFFRKIYLITPSFRKLIIQFSNVLIIIDVLIVFGLIAILNYPSDAFLYRVDHQKQLSFVQKLIVGHDGQNLTAIGEDNEQTWRISDGSHISTIQYPGNFDSIEDLTSDGLAFTTYAYASRTMQLWRYYQGRWLLTDLGKGTGASFSHDDNSVVLFPIDSGVQIWDVHSRSILFTMKGGSYLAWDFSPNDKTIALALTNGVIQLRQISSNIPLLKTVLIPDNLLVRDIFFSPNGKYLASIAQDTKHSEQCVLMVWDIQRGILLYTLKGQYNFTPAFSPDSKVFAWKSSQNSVQIIRVNDGVLLGNVFDEQAAIIVFSPNSQIFATGSKSGIVKLWRLNDVTLLETLRLWSLLTALVFTPDSNTLITASGSDADIQLWRVYH